MKILNRIRFPRNKLVPTQEDEHIEYMAKAGQIVALTLAACQEGSKPGISTAELDVIAETVIRDHHAVPSFKGYHGFPGSICSSVNEVVVHGIPHARTVLAEGDLVSIDCGAIFNGWHGDSAISYGVGELSQADDELNQATRAALFAGIEKMQVGGRLSDISAAIEDQTRKQSKKFDRNFSIIDGFGGHGIGRKMHMDPFVANEGQPGNGPTIVAGSTLAIEPMLSLGSPYSLTRSDGWTVVTKDRARAAHWEHTVVATTEGPRILTSLPI